MSKQKWIIKEDKDNSKKRGSGLKKGNWKYKELMDLYEFRINKEKYIEEVRNDKE